MNIREAILKAAAQLERRPDLFRWESCEIPSSTECGTPGCALGWIAHFVGQSARKEGSEWRVGFVGVPDYEFYCRMKDLTGGNDWKRYAAECARGLRLYADKYHPAPKLGIPDSVRAIFETAQSPVVC